MTVFKNGEMVESKVETVHVEAQGCVTSSQLKVILEQVLCDRRYRLAEPERTPVTVSCRNYREQDLWGRPSAKHSEDVAPVTAGAVAKAIGSRWCGSLAGGTSNEEGLVFENGRF